MVDFNGRGFADFCSKLRTKFCGVVDEQRSFVAGASCYVPIVQGSEQVLTKFILQ